MIRRLALMIGFGLIVAALWVVPMPLFTLSPGSAVPVAERIEFHHQADAISGEFRFLTVKVGRASTVGALYGWLDDDVAVVARDVLVPSGVEDEEYFKAQRKVFEESADVAVAVGLRRAGFPVTVTGEGAQVASVIPRSPADGELRVGDVIVEVDGTPVEVASDLSTVTARASVGQVANLEVRRGDESLTIRIKLEEVSELGRPGLGIAVRTMDRKIRLPFDVEVDQRRIGGPSAGLMIALTVFDLADPGDLTDGRTIAGTGTIDTKGRVGPVGGVEQKVEAAVDAGADVFLAPRAEAARARAAADGRVTVLSVGSIDEAIAELDRG